MARLVIAGVSLGLAQTFFLATRGGVLFWVIPLALIFLNLAVSLSAALHRRSLLSRDLLRVLVWPGVASLCVLLNMPRAWDLVESIERLGQYILVAGWIWLFFRLGRTKGLLQPMFIVILLMSEVAVVSVLGADAGEWMVNPNLVGTILAVTGLHLVMTLKRRITRAVVFTVVIVSLWMLNSLTSLAALFGAWVLRFLGGVLSRRVFRWVVIVAVLLPVLLTTLVLLSDVHLTSDVNLALSGRVRLWQLAVWNSTVFGNGPNSWILFQANYGDDLMLPWKRVSSLQGGGFHNVYVQAAFELGLLGLVICVLFMSILASRYAGSDSRVSAMLIFLAMHGFGEATLGLFTSIGSWPNLLWWAVLAILLGGRYRSRQPSPQGLRDSEAKRKVRMCDA